MGRPRKRADWYQHPNTMKENPCIRALRKRFGNNGYAVLNYLMEDITRTDELALDFSAKKRLLYAAEYDVTQKELEEIVEFCIELELLSYPSPDQSKLCSPYLEEELLKLLMEKREKDRIRKQKINNGEFSTENNEYSTENKTDDIPRKTICIPPKTDDIPRKSTFIPRKSTYSKVKESKLKHSSSADIRAREGDLEAFEEGEKKVFESVDAEIEELRNSPIWKEQVFMRFKFLNLDNQLLEEYLHRWGQEFIISGRSRHLNIGDAKHHFNCWMIIQEDKFKKQEKSSAPLTRWKQMIEKIGQSQSQSVVEQFSQLFFDSFSENEKELVISAPSEDYARNIGANIDILVNKVTECFGKDVKIKFKYRNE